MLCQWAVDHHDGRGSGGGNHGSIDGLDLVDDDDVATNREMSSLSLPDRSRSSLLMNFMRPKELSDVRKLLVLMPRM
jgi:hypothetical protein